MVEIGVGERNHRFVELGVMHHLAHLDSQTAVAINGDVNHWLGSPGGTHRSSIWPRRCGRARRPGADHARRRDAQRRHARCHHHRRGHGRKQAVAKRWQVVQSRTTGSASGRVAWQGTRVKRHRLGRCAVEVGRVLRSQRRAARRRRGAAARWQVAGTVLTHHLLFDLVDLGLDADVGTHAGAGVASQAHLRVINP